MTKERSDQVRQLLDAAQGAQGQPFHLVLGFDELTSYRLGSPDGIVDGCEQLTNLSPVFFGFYGV